MAIAPETQSGVVEAYRDRLRAGHGPADHVRANGYDELIDAVDEPVSEVADVVDRMGLQRLRSSAAQTGRFVRSDGITYGSTEDGAQAHRWVVDPVPVVLGQQDWEPLEAGLQQRATLLDAVLTDLYGERRLLRDRHLPAEIVLGHPGFLRQVDGIRLPARRQLVLSGTDVARGRDGEWLAFDDRAGAPSGAGYAMATRRIIARTLPAVYRSTDTARLRSFFHTFRAALQDVAPHQDDVPRVVVHSPGPASETAFDQAFLATLLGFPLVEADDLAMRDGQVVVRTPGREEKVDVILRRVDAVWADQLDLRGGSQLGVPGMVDAARRGQVSVVNPFGAGVLENPALAHFLPDLSRLLLDQELSLGHLESWWCGDDQQRQHVLGRLDRLVLKTVSPDEGSQTLFGWLLSSAEREQLVARVDAEPWAWTAEEPLPESTAPVVGREGLEARRLVLRCFCVAHGDDYRVMPGALGRTASADDPDMVTGKAGAIAKDVWVLASTQQSDAPWSDDGAERMPPAHVPGIGLTPRIADDLYWMGRYAERAEATARLLRVTDDLTEDYSAGANALGVLAMQSIQHAASMITGIPSQRDDDGALDLGAPDLWEQAPTEHLLELVTDATRAGSVAHAVSHLVQAAQRVRDQVSLDLWPTLSRMERVLDDAAQSDGELRLALEQVVESSLAVAGITHESTVHDRSWRYLDAGYRMERAQHATDLLRATLGIERSPVIEGQVVESLLLVADSVITYRRRTAAGVGPAVPAQAALQLLLRDEENPRSVIFQLDRLHDDLVVLDDDEGAEKVAQLRQRLLDLDLAHLTGPSRSGLEDTLQRLRGELSELSDHWSTTHFRRQPTQRPQRPQWVFAQEVGR